MKTMKNTLFSPSRSPSRSRPPRPPPRLTSPSSSPSARPSTPAITDNCYVKYGQIDSWPAIFARQAGSPAFEQPLFDTPGTGCLYLISLAPQFGPGRSLSSP